MAADSIKIGVAGAHSGDLASYGVPSLNAAKVVIAEVNAKGGVLGRQIELVAQDDQCKPELATNAATKLISEKVNVVMGHICSGATKATLPLYTEAKIVSMNPVLEVKDLSQDFGGLRALNELSLTVNQGEIVALIGPNGAGKTTFFNCVTGIYTPTEGQMFLHDAKGEKQLLNGKKPHIITAMGMARTFQNIRLFNEMTVLENVMIGRHCRTKAGIFGAIVRDARTRKEEQDCIDRSYELLELVKLQEFWNETANNLPYGAQRRLEIARAMATYSCARAVK
jgi:ABC-type branched-chain amino acid transport systems, ATPase component